MTTPTQPTPAPVDLGGLAADLEAEGWTVERHPACLIVRLSPDVIRFYGILRRHTQPTEGAWHDRTKTDV